ncbi:sensor histidine kinase [Micromonospora sp. CPCC 206061]|uniref:sensor histidine kinase n=1 Tax=Micromonospora sp. CPCC 206061 TaxID=3122410 RepID=UPI002FF06A68
MSRHFLAAAVVAVDTALLVAVHGIGYLWVAALFAATVVLAYRQRLAGFGGALLLGAVTAGGYAVLVWTAYRAGRGASKRVLVAVGATGLATHLALLPSNTRMVPQLVVVYLVFVALPAVVGRYVTQQEQLMSVLGDQARLAERLRIARDMHDSLGRRLSLVSIQAAALEVAPLPAEQRRAIGQLGTAAREAMTELYGVIGALREPQCTVDIGALLTQFRDAGVPVTVEPAEPPAVGEAAYRVVEEGLTNAAKHAPGQPVSVSLRSEGDTLLVTVANPATSRPASTASAGGGRGLPGLDERVRLAGGLLHHGHADGRFRLTAMLPVAPAAPAASPPRPALLGTAAAVLVLIVLPVSLMLGVKG